jgi:hypothetical protein
MTRRRTAILLSVLALAALVVPAVAGARPAGPRVGIGDQQANTFKSRAWKRLGLSDARYLTPWDTLQDPRQRGLLDSWMAAARASHTRVLIGLGHSLRSQKRARTLPSLHQFTTQFRALHARYPWVRDWLPWNEANSPGGLTEHRPARAAQYYDAMVRNCRGCRIAAADVLDIPGMDAWITRFRRAVHHKPRVWGLHNYVDANHLRTTSTRRFLALTRSGQVWFTETGGLVLRRAYKGRRVVRTYRYGIKRAARATAQALRLACLSPRITRVYLYEFQAPNPVTSWDSGLLDGHGRVRPAYTVLRKWVARAAHASRSGGRRTLCG